jgi:hypothetical protein
MTFFLEAYLFLPIFLANSAPNTYEQNTYL